MKRIALLLVVLSGSALADQYVNPYIRQDGSYVQGYMRSSPNSSTYDNYSTRGNTNPYTGERGYTNPAPTYPSYPSYGTGYGGYQSPPSRPYGYGR